MADEPQKRDDLKWRTKVDERQITLLTGHQSHHDRLGKLEDQVDELEADVDNLKLEYERQSDKVTKLYAVVFQDSTGQKGLLHDVDVLMGRRQVSTLFAEHGWKFITATVLALVSFAGLVVTNLDKIESFAKSVQAKVDPPPKVEPKKKSKAAKPKKKLSPKPVLPAALPPLSDVVGEQQEDH